MKIKRFLLVFLIGLLAIGLTSCRLPASTPPESSPTVEEGGFPIPGAGTETMGLFETIATQTAQAMGGGGPIAEVTPEPQEGEPPTEEAPTEAPAPAEEPAPEPPAAEEPAPEPPAPVQPAIEIPEPTPGVPETYTLQRGEFPYCIARRFNINPSELLAANGMNANSRTQPGQVLRIPQSANPWPGSRALASHPTTYTVRSEDTIFSIACQFGDVDPYMIALANELSSPYTLSPGQTIHIP